MDVHQLTMAAADLQAADSAAEIVWTMRFD
jgi:hypothetical protein